MGSSWRPLPGPQGAVESQWLGLDSKLAAASPPATLWPGARGWGSPDLPGNGKWLVLAKGELVPPPCSKAGRDIHS